MKCVSDVNLNQEATDDSRMASALVHLVSLQSVVSRLLEFLRYSGSHIEPIITLLNKLITRFEFIFFNENSQINDGCPDASQSLTQHVIDFNSLRNIRRILHTIRNAIELIK